MDKTALTKYVTDEYPSAVKFYDDRARAAKLQYRILSVFVVAASASLTALVAFSSKDCTWRVISTTVSATIVIATGLLAHLKCHENWLSYRASWDALEREKRLFESGVGEYQSAEDKGALFVEQIEAIRAREGAGFYARHAKGEEPAKKPELVHYKGEKAGEKKSKHWYKKLF